MRRPPMSRSSKLPRSRRSSRAASRILNGSPHRQPHSRASLAVVNPRASPLATRPQPPQHRHLRLRARHPLRPHPPRPRAHRPLLVRPRHRRDQPRLPVARFRRLPPVVAQPRHPAKRSRRLRVVCAAVHRARPVARRPVDRAPVAATPLALAAQVALVRPAHRVLRRPAPGVRADTRRAQVAPRAPALVVSVALAQVRAVLVVPAVLVRVVRVERVLVVLAVALVVPAVGRTVSAGRHARRAVLVVVATSTSCSRTTTARTPRPTLRFPTARSSSSAACRRRSSRRR